MKLISLCLCRMEVERGMLFKKSPWENKKTCLAAVNHAYAQIIRQ